MKISAKIKNLFNTIFYFIIVLGICFGLEKILPSDMCNPGIGIFLLMFLAPIITVALLFYNFYLLSKWQKATIKF